MPCMPCIEPGVGRFGKPGSPPGSPPGMPGTPGTPDPQAQGVGAAGGAWEMATSRTKNEFEQKRTERNEPRETPAFTNYSCKVYRLYRLSTHALWHSAGLEECCCGSNIHSEVGQVNKPTFLYMEYRNGHDYIFNQWKYDQIWDAIYIYIYNLIYMSRTFQKNILEECHTICKASKQLDAARCS